MFIASDRPATLEHTRRMVFLDNGEMALVTADGYQILRLDDGTPVTKEIHTIPWDPVSAAKGKYRHFMEKEIYHPARTVTDPKATGIIRKKNTPVPWHGRCVLKSGR